MHYLLVIFKFKKVGHLYYFNQQPQSAVKTMKSWKEYRSLSEELVDYIELFKDNPES
jgi:hypothetical protein